MADCAQPTQKQKRKISCWNHVFHIINGIKIQYIIQTTCCTDIKPKYTSHTTY